MKKILAGVLAAASILTMTVSASAAAASNDKPIKAAGEVEYDVAVTAPKVVLDLILPAKIAAALNPYGADIVLSTGADADDPADDVTTSKGIASVAYTITNNSKDYGVFLDATATTTTSSKDIVVKKAAPTANTKEAQLALVGAADADALKTIADAGIPTASAAFADPDQGVLVLDSTVVADKTTGVAAGQTKQKKFMFIPAAAADGTASTAAMGFLGDLGTGDDVEWGEDDAINVALILKVVAGPKGAPAGGPGVTTARVTGATATVQGTAVNASDITVNSTAKTVTITSGASVGNTIAVTLTLDAGCTLGTVTATDGSKLASPTATGNVVSGTFIAAGGGFTALVNNGADDETWTVTVN